MTATESVARVAPSSRLWIEIYIQYGPLGGLRNDANTSARRVACRREPATRLEVHQNQLGLE